MITIDVIIPAQNEQDRIEQSINQFKQANIGKVIVINDHSTDKTPILAQRANAEVIDFPTVLAQPHQSTLYTYGKNHSKADYVLIADVDEAWDRTFLENAKTIVENKIKTYPIPIFGYKFPRFTLYLIIQNEANP